LSLAGLFAPPGQQSPPQLDIGGACETGLQLVLLLSVTKKQAAAGTGGWKKNRRPI